MKKFCVVIPAYNEASTIADIARRSMEVCEHVVIIDDGSTDDTASEIRSVAGVVCLQNPENEGKAMALSRGMLWALEHDMDYVITLDGDGQHRPEDIPRFMDAARTNPGKIIIGSRMANKAAFPKKRYYANRIASFWISWTAGYAIEDSQSGFRLYPCELFRKLTIKKTRAYGFVFESEILIKASRLGITSISLPIDAIYHEHARPSHFRPVMDIVRITLMVSWRMLSRVMHPIGFYKAFISPRLQDSRITSLGLEGLFSFILSNFLVVLTAGALLLYRFYQVVSTAIRASSDCEPTQWILVLGRHITSEYNQRLDRAIELAAKDAGSRILLLGGKPRDTRLSEAGYGRQYLLGKGIAGHRIVTEEKSRHTLENMLQARDLLEQKPGQTVTLVSSRSHLARAHGLADSLGIDHQMCAAEAEISLKPAALLTMLLEAYYLNWIWAARVWARVTGRTGHVGPVQ